METAMMTLFNDHALLILVGFPALLIGVQAFLAAFPSNVGRVEGFEEEER